MKITAGVFMVAFVIQTVSSLHCYHCTNTDSWEQCSNMTRDAICGKETIGQCVWLTLKIKNGDRYIMKYSRGCAKMCDAKKNPRCGLQEITCKVKCCHGDYCNRLNSSTTTTTTPPPPPREPPTEAFSGSDNHKHLFTYQLFSILLFYIITLL